MDKYSIDPRYTTHKNSLNKYVVSFCGIEVGISNSLLGAKIKSMSHQSLQVIGGEIVRLSRN